MDSGSVVEMIPILIIGVTLVLASLQIALFMSGSHAVELAAFRAAREERTEVARETCWLGYPSAYSSVSSGRGNRRTWVRMRMDPVMPLPGGRTLGPVTVQAQDPPVTGD